MEGFGINVFGPIRVMHAFLPLLRAASPVNRDAMKDRASQVSSSDSQVPLAAAQLQPGR
jgi:hypothetical protein